MQPARWMLLATAAALSGAAAPAFPAPDGAKIYQGTCIVCHGPEGHGALPGVPDFGAQKQRLAQSPAVLLQHVKGGFQSSGSPMGMPPKGGNPSLTDDDLKAVIQYMKENFGR